LKIFFIGVGPGDPELLTLKAYRIIKESDVIFYTGSLISPEIKEFFENKECYDTSKMTIEEIVNKAYNLLLEDKKVSILHDGDPSIYGAISEQIYLFENKGIDVEVIPGISSFQLSSSLLGIELTCPQGPQSIIITRLPYRTNYEKKLLLARNASIIIFLSIHLIDKVKQQLLEVFPEDFPFAVVYHAGWKDQKILMGSIKDIDNIVKSNKIYKTALIIISECLKRVERHSNLYSENFTHSYRRSK